ncbi:hypothetical protein NPIL_215101, partial [Nephila pilipes]
MSLVLLICPLLGFLFFIIRCSLWRRKYSRLLPGSKPRLFDILADLKQTFVFEKTDDKYALHH